MADLNTVTATAATPLTGREPLSVNGVSIRELPNLGKVTLRGDATDKAFADAAAKVLGVALPTEPMTSANSGDIRVFWKAFDEWLIWTPEGGEGKLIADLRSALDGLRKAVVDVSDYYTVIRVEGVHARTLLAKGCAVDLHPRAFNPGQATGTGFHHATIFITLADADTFDVMIRWSFADYLWTYFADGMQEWA